MSFPSTPDPNAINQLQQSVSLTLDLKFQEFLRADNEQSRKALIQHWHLWQDQHKSTLLSSDQRLTEAIREALYGGDLQLKANAFQAMGDLIDFELMSDLVKVTVQPNYVHKETSGQVLSKLAVQLFQQHQHDRRKGQLGKSQAVVENSVEGESNTEKVSAGDSLHRSHWPANRRHLREQLENAVQNYRQHERTEILLAYLLFTDYADPFVKRALSLETHEAHGDLLGLLYESRALPVVEKLAGYISVRNPPLKLARLWLQRKDWLFVTSLLTAIAEGSRDVVTSNLRRLEKPRWLEECFQRIAELSVDQQTALLRVVVSGVADQESRLEWMMRLLTVASLPVRRETVTEICRIPGARANKVVSYLVDQEQDAACLAALLPELRKRNIQGAMKRLLVFLDHSHADVRQAAGQAFKDCSVQRYLAAFDMLNEAVRVSTGQLVHKVDPNTNRVLQDELVCAARGRRLRALIAIRCIGNACELQDTLLRLLADEDPKIREATLGTVALCHNLEVQRHIRRAMMDEDPRVRKAAERALQTMAGG